MSTQEDLRVDAPADGNDIVVTAPARLGARIGATVVDVSLYLVLYVLSRLVGFAADGIVSEGLGDVVRLVGLISVPVVAVWNAVFRQGTKAATVGKWLLGLVVVDADTAAEPIGAQRAMVRWVASVAGFSALFMQDHRGVHDLAAKSQVVRGSYLPQSLDRAQQVAAVQRLEGWRRRLPMLPALLFTIVVTQVPFGFSLWYSLTDWKVVPPSPRNFVGVDNYTSLVDNQFFREAVWVSVLMTVSSVVLSVLLGTLIALLLDRKFFGQGFVRTLLITPFLIMPVVAGLVWKNQMFSATFGVINWLLDAVGVDRIEFTSQYPLWSIVAVLVWQWTPFMMLIILAGLQSQPTSVLEAAKVDGASGWATFSQITLPHLRRYIELGILLGSIYLIQVFDHISVMTGGGPDSTNVPFFVFQRSIGGGWRFGQASAFSIVVVIASIILATLGLRVLSGLLEGEDA